MAYLGRRIAVALLVGGALLLAAGPLLEGGPAPYIHIRWSAALDDESRQQLEWEHGLRERARDGRSFGYDLVDPSSGNVRALLSNTAVEDTEGFDRQAFRVAAGVEQGRHQTGWAWQWGVEERLPAIYAMARAAVALGVLLLLVLTRRGIAFVRALHPSQLRQRISGSIPPLTPLSFAVFRVAFAVMLAVLLLHNGIWSGAFPPAEQRELHVPFTGWIHQLAAIDGATATVQRITAVSLVLFAAGFLSRVSYAVATLGFNIWFCIWAMHAGTHALGTLPLALIALLIVPWHEGVSVDRWLWRATRPSRVPFGFAPWMLALAMAIGFAAAAFAKVRTGPGWILNGTVRYHFMAESEIALVPWGLWIAARPWLSVLLSGIAVVVEAIAIVGVFCGPRIRLLFAAMIGSIITGFILFHAAIWPAWWVLLLGFLPWEWCDRTSGAGSRVDGGARRLLPASALVMAAALLLQQIPVSWRSLEVAPYLSAYDMYSATFSSPAEFERANGGPRFHILATTPGRELDVGDCVRADQAAITAMTDALRDAEATEFVPPPARDRITRCASSIPEATAVRVLADQRVFDWENGRTGFAFENRLLGEWPLTR